MARIGRSFPAKALLGTKHLVVNNERRYQVSWAELEVPNAPRRYQVSWAEFEVPDALRRYLLSWTEFEVPDGPPSGDPQFQRAAYVGFPAP